MAHWAAHQGAARVHHADRNALTTRGRSHGRTLAAVQSAQFQLALAATHAGKPEAFKDLWSHRGDVSIFGALGGLERGWTEVAPRLDWASTQVRATDTRVENILTVVGPGMAVTADLEQMMRIVNDRPVPRTLRCTQVYRIEDGEWRIFHRHADELRPAAR